MPPKVVLPPVRFRAPTNCVSEAKPSLPALRLPSIVPPQKILVLAALKAGHGLGAAGVAGGVVNERSV